MERVICMIKIMSLLTLYILFIINSLLFAQSFRTKVNDANNLFNEEKYDEALIGYQDALLDDPQNAIVHFNQGDSHYKLEKYDKALDDFARAEVLDKSTNSYKAMSGWCYLFMMDIMVWYCSASISVVI